MFVLNCGYISVCLCV